MPAKRRRRQRIESRRAQDGSLPYACAANSLRRTLRVGGFGSAPNEIRRRGKAGSAVISAGYSQKLARAPTRGRMCSLANANTLVSDHGYPPGQLKPLNTNLIRGRDPLQVVSSSILPLSKYECGSPHGFVRPHLSSLYSECILPFGDLPSKATYTHIRRQLWNNRRRRHQLSSPPLPACHLR